MHVMMQCPSPFLRPTISPSIPPQVGVPPGRIFTINPKGELRKASVLVQSSALSSLRSINELVGNIFPPLPAHVRRVPPSGSAE